MNEAENWLPASRCSRMGKPPRDWALKVSVTFCKASWRGSKPGSVLEQAVYDPDSRMLRGFLAGLAGHLTPGGEGWLVLSDLAEHLGLRTRAQLEDWIAQAGLEVVGRLDIRPRHPKIGRAHV